MDDTHFDVVVVGGGAVGASAARYLAEAGVDVALFEAARLGDGSTVRSAGGIRQQFGDERRVRLAMESRALFSEYAAETDAFDLAETGYLFLATTDEEVAGFQADADRQRDLGLDVDLVDPADCADLVPGLRTDDLALGKYCPTDCYTDPGAVARWLGERAADLGVTVREGEPVTDVRVADGRVDGVETARGAYDCDAVVNAAGVWADAVARTAGVGLPVTPTRIQIAVAERALVPTDAPFVVDVHERSYFRPTGDTTLVGRLDDDRSDPADPERYDERYDAAFVDRVAEFVDRRLDVDDFAAADGWAGLRGLTPDGAPLVGEVDAVSGFYVAAGWNGHGFMLAPAVGRSLARYVRTGEWDGVDLAAYDPDRFDGEESGDGDGFMGVS